MQDGVQYDKTNKRGSLVEYGDESTNFNQSNQGIIGEHY
jgi:hypothetical protein